MGNAITFTLGPAAVRISGAHRVTQWARRTFGVLETPSAPDVAFEFTDGAVHPVDGVGDEHTRICADAMSFAGSRFDTRISLDRARGTYRIMLRDRDRRSLMRRTLADPEES
ncbi:MAG: hypothetical protein CMJ49_09235 [Planctomycetaceae bacterium]|nr:hypothetical protein [Planctomycetaceae bacterium]